MFKLNKNRSENFLAFVSTRYVIYAQILVPVTIYRRLRIAHLD